MTSPSPTGTERTYFIAHDGSPDGQWFVVPVDRRAEFEKWVDAETPEEYEPLELRHVMGPQGLTFTNPHWGTEIATPMFTSPTPPAAAQGLSEELFTGAEIVIAPDQVSTAAAACAEVARKKLSITDADMLGDWYGEFQGAIGDALQSPGPAAVTEDKIAAVLKACWLDGTSDDDRGRTQTARAFLKAFRIEEK